MTEWRVVAELAERLAAESGKLRKRALLAEVLTRVAAGDVRDAGRVALYIAGQPFAEADARKLQVGGSLLARAIVAVCGATEAALAAAMRVHGDMGAAAADVFAQKPSTAPLTLTEIAESFALLATAGGTARRQQLVETLLQRASSLEAKYLVKLMLGDMRIGVKQSLVEEAIAVASAQPVEAVRRAVMLEADLARVVERSFAGTLAEARMQLFHPLGFMLASPVESPEEAVERFAPELEDEAALEDLTDYEAAIAQVRIAALLEDKFDGIRAQLHVGAGSDGVARVAVYSRTREEITESFPELVEAFARTQPAGGGVILDGELLAWEFATETALPFSTLGQRIGRKRVDAAMRRAVPVVFMAFDVLYADEALLLDEPLEARRARLERLVAELAPQATAPLEPVDRSAQASLFAMAESEASTLPRLRISPAQRVEDAAAIDRAYAEARARGNEGVMLKAMQSVYQPGRRGLAWCKLKRELATLDVVITGAEFGHGRRAGLLSDYTFAVRGEDGCLLNVGKAYSGLTDEEIAAMTAWLQAHTLEDRGHFRTVEPVRVLEVAFNNVMRSDRHASGFALRFPRILRIRDDKPVEEIDTLARVEAIYQSQPDKPRG